MYVRGVDGHRDKEWFLIREENLGEYDETIIEKRKEVENRHWAYTPNGFDIKAEIQKNVHSITITIGEKYHHTFNIGLKFN